MNNINNSEAYNLKNLIDYSTDSTVSKVLLKNNAGNITLFSFDKNQELSEHSAPFDAFVQVLDGVITITIDSKPNEVKEGEIIIMPANIPHSLKALEKSKMLLTMIKG